MSVLAIVRWGNRHDLQALQPLVTSWTSNNKHFAHEASGFTSDGVHLTDGDPLFADFLDVEHVFTFPAKLNFPSEVAIGTGFSNTPTLRNDNAHRNLRSSMGVASRRLGDGFMLLDENACDCADGDDRGRAR
jgi:hypothetical protein